MLARLPTKTIILGVIDLSDMAIEAPATVAERIRRALVHVAPGRLVVAPDCGMKYLPREVAFGKMKAMVDGAALVRRQLEAAPQRGRNGFSRRMNLPVRRIGASLTSRQTQSRARSAAGACVIVSSVTQTSPRA